MLRGRTDRYHRLGFIIAFTVAAVATPIQMGVGDALARWVYNNQPVKFAAIELVPHDQQRRPRDAARPAQLRRHGQRRHPDPRAGLVAVRPEHRHGRRSSRASTRVPADDRPTVREVNIVHLAWDVMVGLGTLLFLLSLWYGASWIFRRRMPASQVVPAGGRRARACSPWSAMEAGWVVTEVGRQPWIVYNYHEGRGRRHRQHRGLDHVHRGRRCSTSRSASPRSSSCAAMSRRFRRARRVRRPRRALRHRARRRRAGAEARGGGPMSTAVAVVLLLGRRRRTPCSAAPTSAPASGT